MSGSLKDHTVEQNWPAYTEDEHAIWRLLFERQQKLLNGRACREYLDGLQGLGVASHGIPDFRRLSDILDRATEELYAIVTSERARRGGKTVDRDTERLIEMAESCRQQHATDRLAPVLASFGLLDS